MTNWEWRWLWNFHLFFVQLVVYYRLRSCCPSEENDNLQFTHFWKSWYFGVSSSLVLIFSVLLGQSFSIKYFISKLQALTIKLQTVCKQLLFSNADHVLQTINKGQFLMLIHSVLGKVDFWNSSLNYILFRF